jgi:biopolymer transport protein ExbB/TolQ
MANLAERVSSWLYKIGFPVRLVPILAVLAATVLYVLNLWGGRYISVPGSSLIFELSQFQNCEITFSRPTRIYSYRIGKLTGSKENPGETSGDSFSELLNSDVTSLHVKNPYFGLPPVAAAGSNQYRINVTIGPTLETEISSVLIDGKRTDLNSFANENIRSRGAQFVKFHYIRKELSEVIYRLNDALSNWILTAMFFGLVLMLIRLAGMEILAYAFGDNRFRKHLIKKLNVKELVATPHNRKAFEKYIAEWHKRDYHLRFLQALGPAVGFILTVSSLVQALHPATRTANDLDSFLTGIHIAMVSTFLGLLMRLIALEASRVNDFLLQRADMQFSDKEAEAAPANTPAPPI